jgi:transmembrane sensor
MPTPKKIADLLFKYLRNELTEREHFELNNWRQESDTNEMKFKELTDLENIREIMKDYYSYKDKAWKKLLVKAPELGNGTVKKSPYWKELTAAALIAAILGVSLYILLNRRGKQHVSNQQISKIQDVPPGTNKAVLTLSNGSRMLLGTDKNDSIVQQLGNNIENLDSKSLAYSRSKGGGQKVVFNTLETPRGGQFQLFLPDGTKVWLNAASYIKFPVSFTGKDRQVEMSGEVYFEVAKNPRIPFSVKVQNAVIEVIGTHFNIMAYTDETILVATLLEGSVRVTNGVNTVRIKPGEQARINNHAVEIDIVRDIDGDDIVAWKNGRTFFKDADIKSIMRMISRWYDVDVSYQGDIPIRSITGGISRNANLSELLKVLELNKIHFSAEGKKIKVLP